MSNVPESDMERHGGAIARLGRLVWLSYLLLYPLPWLDVPPSRTGLILSGLGVALFLASYAHAYGKRPRSALPDVLLMAAIGFGLSPFGGAWSVFVIFAIAFAARMEPQRHAYATMALLLTSLPLAGLALGLPWIGWAAGLLFGGLAGVGTLLQADLERRHRQLLAARHEVRVLAAAAERERIGRDLHDLLGHTLTLIAIKADLAVRLCPAAADAASREMEDVARSAREGLGEVRRAVAGMSGANLAAEWVRAGHALAAAGVVLRAEGDPDTVEPTAGAVLAMVLREAVTNVVRHATARTCFLSVARDPDGTSVLRVGDDGRGGTIEAGAGLSGMRTRIVAAGGTVTIQSRAGGGTLLSARLPVLREPAGIAATAAA
ncbi:sensor histidine kinase [Acetobacteraceae bacterium KSS8]|uniref:Sensor histidine kinase n=1 Tax=Endosaccharibacter trunci TaxID=2812733 RepID=A0ABT1W5Y5_9PROT|nr:sensor histidine kinase [Acetobacteraceae bacterium KSS8]